MKLSLKREWMLMKYLTRCS